MKKILAIVALIVVLVIPGFSVAATPGACTESVVRDASSTMVTVTLACTGNSANGTFPTITLSDDVMTLLKDKYLLYEVWAFPTPAGTAPDAADVTVNMDGQDLLGTKGVNLIHATATYDTFPYSSFMSAYRYPLIVNTITIGIANQATASANLTLRLIFSR